MTALVIGKHNEIAAPVGIRNIECKTCFTTAVGSDVFSGVNSIATTAIIGRDILVRSVPPPVPAYFIHGYRHVFMAEWFAVFAEYYCIESVVLLGVVIIVFVGFGQT